MLGDNWVVFVGVYYGWGFYEDGVVLGLWVVWCFGVDWLVVIL